MFTGKCVKKLFDVSFDISHAPHTVSDEINIIRKKRIKNIFLVVLWWVAGKKIKEEKLIKEIDFGD